MKYRAIKLALLVALLVVKAYYLGRSTARSETWQDCREIYDKETRR